MEVPQAQVGLSTASVYPEGCAAAFELAARLGYDGVEVMVWTDPLTREAGALRSLAELHGIRVLSVHAPTLLITQRVWGTDPWDKIDRSIELAAELDADTVVLHPPFRWQRDYAKRLRRRGRVARERHRDAARRREHVPVAGTALPRGGGLPAALGPGAPALRPRDPRPLAHGDRRVRRDGDGAAARARGFAHLHLADGVGSPRDEHLVPGRGTQPCGEVLETLAGSGYAGHVVVEVATRRATEAQRELDLAEALAFARLHLAASA